MSVQYQEGSISDQETKKREKKKKNKKNSRPNTFTGANCHRTTNTIRSYSRHSPRHGRFSLSVSRWITDPRAGFVNAFPALVRNSSLLVHSKGQGRQYVFFLVFSIENPFCSPGRLLDLGGDHCLMQVLRCGLRAAGAGVDIVFYRTLSCNLLWRRRYRYVVGYDGDAVLRIVCFSSFKHSSLRHCTGLARAI